MKKIKIEQKEITIKELYNYHNIYTKNNLKSESHLELIGCLDYMRLEEVPLDILGNMVDEVLKNS